jgi:hypothetical protein
MATLGSTCRQFLGFAEAVSAYPRSKANAVADAPRARAGVRLVTHAAVLTAFALELDVHEVEIRLAVAKRRYFRRVRACSASPASWQEKHSS